MLYAIAIAIGALRIIGIKAAWFQASAHMFLGYLLGASVFGAKVKYEIFPGININVDENMMLFVGLTIIEVVCFLVFKFVL